MLKNSLLSLGVLVDGGVCPQTDPQRVVETEVAKFLGFFLTWWVLVPCVRPKSFHLGASKSIKLQMFLSALGGLDVTVLSDLSSSHSLWLLPVKSAVIFRVSVLLFGLTQRASSENSKVPAWLSSTRGVFGEC